MNISDYLTYIFNYSQQCITLPVHTFECSDFWFYCFITFLIFCFYIILLLVKRLLKDKALIAEYQKKKIMRAAIADEESMKNHQWLGVTDFDDIDQSELAGQMREKIRERTKTNNK